MQQPILDRIVVKPDDGEEMFGPIIIPDSAVEQANRGTVIMIGPGKTCKCGNLEQIGVEAGDKVIYSAFAGTQITIDGDDLLIMRWHDCLMRFRDDADQSS